MYSPQKDVGKVRIVDISPGHIHGHRYLRIPLTVPVTQKSAGAVPHILVQLCDESISLEQRNEFPGRLEPPFRMNPPYQSLCS